MALFQTERWDPSSAPEMQWHFPVTAGSYEVRLAFAEIYEAHRALGLGSLTWQSRGRPSSTTTMSSRMWGYKGVVKSFTVSSDANLDITFGHVVENPAIKGIEIVSAGAPNQLAASPTSPTSARRRSAPPAPSRSSSPTSAAPATPAS